jgi:hypothetical protein
MGRKGRLFARILHVISQIFVPDAFSRSSDSLFAGRAAVGLFRGLNGAL